MVLVASNKTPTLLDHSYQQHYSAPRGEHGRGKLQHGKNGEDLEVFVPVGTLVRDAETNVELADLVHEGDRFIAAFGGRGGRGNASFKSSTNRAPQYSQPGEKGEQRRLKLELKLLLLQPPKGVHEPIILLDQLRTSRSSPCYLLNQNLRLGQSMDERFHCHLAASSSKNFFVATFP